MKYSFYNDYSEGAHPQILEALTATNFIQETGYGEDSFSLKAAQLIKDKLASASADIHLVSNGTQANFIVLAALLRPHESVIAATTGHINVHEAGAVEAAGHKINTIPTTDGKITPKQIEEIVLLHSDEHMVKPKIVYISQPTELGTIYGKQELKDISAVCKEHNLYLYLDGARLGSALMSRYNDSSLEDIAKFVDAFYIGGTKNGALLGEAIVILNPDLQKDFRYFIKQRGALLAKGRVLGIQFVELFKDNLYFSLATHANTMANKLADGIENLNYKFLTDSPTNQIFPILPNSIIAELEKMYGFYVWSKIDGSHSAIRLVTSWATKEEVVQIFIKDLASLTESNLTGKKSMMKNSAQ